MLYLTDLPEDSPTRQTIRYHVKALSVYWGEKSLADVKGSTCRQYVLIRTKPHNLQQTLKGSAYSYSRSVAGSTARQELKTFQAAINHWHRESPLSAVPKVSLPKPGSRRERVLERTEVARMLLACRRLSRQGHKAAKGAVQYTDYSHVARFILIGLYTGTRHDALLGLRWSETDKTGHIDVARGIVFRRGAAEPETSKRRPPVASPRILRSLLARWHDREAKELRCVIHYKGQRVTKMRRAWNTVREAAGLGPEVTPHTLRHTCVSWHLWDGKTTWEVGQIVGADAATIDRVYGHHKLDGKHRGFVNPKARKE